MYKDLKQQIREGAEREFWLGESSVYLGEDNIAYVNAVGKVDDELAAQIKEMALQLLDIAGTELSFLIDINRAGKSTPEARRMFQALATHEKIRKVATYGIHPVARIVATFGLGKDFTMKYHRFFKNREEALAWLKE